MPYRAAFPLVLAALAAAPGLAGSAPEAGATPGPDTPAVSARPPLEPGGQPPTPDPIDVLLPPRVRPSRAVTTLEAAGGESSGGNGRLVERIEPPGAETPELEWLEIEYTIDPVLDEKVRDVLEVGRVELGHVVVMDPTDGSVLTYVSTDPERFPATGTYPTASLAKVVTAAAVLQNNPEAATRDCRYVGSPYDVGRAQLTPPRSGGRVDNFWRALAISNNQCFARLAVHDVGEEAMLREIERVGLLEPPAAGHDPGRLEPIESDLDLGHLGSGLAGSFISPLAAVRLATLLAEGELVRPRWIAQVTDARGQPYALAPLEPPRRVWPREVADELRTLMVGVTARGTAKSAFRDPRGRPLLGDVRVSGKTGSLSGKNPKGRYEWFIGVAPAESPRIAIAAVVVNKPRWWRNASQIAAEVLKRIFCEKGRCRPEAADRFRTTLAMDPAPAPAGPVLAIPAE